MTDPRLVASPAPDDPEVEFESLGQENGQRYWWESDICRLLGYEESTSAWKKAVGRAMAACTALEIPVRENFLTAEREVDGEPMEDCKLSRFACYLVAMNADPRKPAVARAQAYFAAVAEAARQIHLEQDAVERVVIRDEMKDREKSLAGVAKASGVHDYGLFQNAGYRGLYNKNISQIKSMKGVKDGHSLLDYMGREELAANLFRITQTESKIRKDNVRGQRQLEQTAEDVGKHVRRTIKEIGGTMPENLPAAQHLPSIASSIKKTARELQRLDKPKKAAKKNKPKD